MLYKMDTVRGRGLEPPCLAAPAPKAGASTNFATRARYPLYKEHFPRFGSEIG